MCERYGCRAVVQSQARCAGGISSGVSAYALLVGVGSRHHECARSGGQVHFLRILHRLAGMGKRELDAASARLCRAGHHAGETDATGGSGQTHVSSWIGGVDNHQGALGRTRAIGPYLVAE